MIMYSFGHFNQHQLGGWLLYDFIDLSPDGVASLHPFEVIAFVHDSVEHGVHSGSPLLVLFAHFVTK